MGLPHVRVSLCDFSSGSCWERVGVSSHRKLHWIVVGSVGCSMPCRCVCALSGV